VAEQYSIKYVVLIGVTGLTSRPKFSPLSKLSTSSSNSFSFEGSEFESSVDLGVSIVVWLSSDILTLSMNAFATLYGVVDWS